MLLLFIVCLAEHRVSFATAWGQPRCGFVRKKEVHMYEVCIAMYHEAIYFPLMFVFFVSNSSLKRLHDSGSQFCFSGFKLRIA